MLSLQINAESPSKLIEAVRDLLASLIPATAPALSIKGEVLPPVDAKPAGKRGPKPKAPEPVQTDIEDVKAPEQDVVKAYVYDDVVNACKQLLSKHGMPELRKLLSQFGAEQTKGLKPEQYADVIAAADEWVLA